MPPATLSHPGTLQCWLQLPASSKRKRDDHDDDGRSATVTDDSASGEIVRDRAPAKKKLAKSSSKPKIAATKSSGSKPTNTFKEAKKLCTETLKAVEKRYIELDKKVKAMSGNSRAITVATYATSAAKHLSTAKKLAATGETVLAFNFVMALGDASHRSMSTSKMSGDCGDCDDRYARLDEALLALIEKREEPATAAQVEELPSVPHRWEREDADVGPFKTGNGPNKQQRGQMDRHYIDWEKKRREARRARRETCGDWVAAALSDLVEDRNYLKEFGVGEDFHSWREEQQANSYFRNSIAKLEELAAARL
ncbi:hypothetical protein LTR08_002897 [Meristemomyces frigidus]|nr:hypothetical protein LTR08_002897 [Meristemomyces frigidus]